MNMDIKVVKLKISWNLEAMQKFDESNVMDIEYIYIPPQPHPTPPLQFRKMNDIETIYSTCV